MNVETLVYSLSLVALFLLFVKHQYSQQFPVSLQYFEQLIQRHTLPHTVAQLMDDIRELSPSSVVLALEDPKRGAIKFDFNFLDVHEVAQTVKYAMLQHNRAVIIIDGIPRLAISVPRFTEKGPTLTWNPNV